MKEIWTNLDIKLDKEQLSFLEYKFYLAKDKEIHFRFIEFIDQLKNHAALNVKERPKQDAKEEDRESEEAY
jgi:hypothetical protein